jgi:hypothetical protein
MVRWRSVVQELNTVVGNRTCPAQRRVDPSWLTWAGGTIPRLARTIYEERDVPSGHLDAARLAVLADALEEAGCDNKEVLEHCREAGPHTRGCWPVDLILGKG